MSRVCELYRHFDADGTLLYVGISFATTARLAGHKSGSGWFHKITRIEIERFPSKREALDAEMRAIGNEKPIHNLVRPDRKGINSRREEEKAKISELISAIEARGYKVRHNSCWSVLNAVWKDVAAGKLPDRSYLSAMSPYPTPINPS